MNDTSFIGRVATKDGSRGLQPTVGSAAVRCRVATQEPDGRRALHPSIHRPGFLCRYATSFPAALSRGLKPTATVLDRYAVIQSGPRHTVTILERYAVIQSKPKSANRHAVEELPAGEMPIPTLRTPTILPR